MNNVIIEGTDKVGKSTLALELGKRLVMPIVNRIPHVGNRIFVDCLEYLLDDRRDGIIIDRLHLSELAYGPVKRGKIAFDFREFRILEMILSGLDSFNIYCYDDIETIKKRCIDLKEDFITGDEVDEVIHNFQDVLENKTILAWHRYRIGDNIDNLADEIIKHFEKSQSERRVRFVKQYRTIGNLSGKYLFLGEKYGDKLLPPLVPFGNNNPGLMLFKAIEKSKFPFNQVIMSNVIKSCDKIQVNDNLALAEEAGLKNVEKIVCLGNASFERANEILSNDERIVKIPHSSYWAQYSGKSIDDYVKLINAI